MHLELLAELLMRSELPCYNEIETSYGIKAWKRWGNTAEQIIKSNPYVLCIQGVDLSFSRADAVAAKSDIPADSECRIKAGITYILRQST